jgi:hypothetical protein
MKSDIAHRTVQRKIIAIGMRCRNPLICGRDGTNRAFCLIQKWLLLSFASEVFMKVKVFEGGCLCSWIRFQAKDPAQKPHTCSCKMCQRHTGALTAAWVEFPSDDVVWNGEGGPPHTYRSSAFSSRAFCPRCGSSIGAIDDKPIVALLLGAFDRPNSRELAPQYHSYRTTRPKWWAVEVKD